MRNKYPAGLKSEPELSDLMNEVAAVIPNKWQQVGIVLNVSDGDLSCFVQLDSQKCFISVFTTWRNKETSPYTWQTVVKALQSPTVGENKLAKDINSKLFFVPGIISIYILTYIIMCTVLYGQFFLMFEV